MARTTDEIQRDLQQKWMDSEALQELYGFAQGAQFAGFYSKASIENMILYIVAYCAHVLETLYETTKSEIEDKIAQQVPGTCLWYAYKLKEFLYGFDLDEWGEPLTDGRTDQEIASAQVIKHAVAIDDPATGYLLLKIAGESDGRRCPLPQYETAIRNYILRIKYAGVKTRLINADGDVFNAAIDIWYDPLREPGEVEDKCRAAADRYLQNLPFNGEFSIMALTDALQEVDGAKVVQVQQDECYAIDAGGSKSYIRDKATPYAGYYTSGAVKFNMKEYA